jgi:hypothetical protein
MDENNDETTTVYDSFHFSMFNLDKSWFWARKPWVSVGRAARSLGMAGGRRGRLTPPRRAPPERGRAGCGTIRMYCNPVSASARTYEYTYSTGYSTTGIAGGILYVLQRRRKNPTGSVLNRNRDCGALRHDSLNCLWYIFSV